MTAFITSIQIIALFSVAMAFDSRIRTSPIGIGDTAPDSTLSDHRGETITLTDARGKSPVVLVFYRGYW